MSGTDAERIARLEQMVFLMLSIMNGTIFAGADGNCDTFGAQLRGLTRKRGGTGSSRSSLTMRSLRGWKRQRVAEYICEGYITQVHEHDWVEITTVGEGHIRTFCCTSCPASRTEPLEGSPVFDAIYRDRSIFLETVRARGVRLDG